MPLYLGHQYILNSASIELGYNLLDAYLFYLLAYILVTTAIELVNKLQPIYTGMAYMWSFVIKLILFGALFYSKLFEKVVLPYEDRLSIIAPLLIYILFEVLYCVKVIKLTE
ncbi:DUF6168 family protein, partial [Fulvivirga lutimaris]|uniref:DUF6168 family protein n=1 Tax=Fulvivirga lutimaris TaxID=1819566 RepID=UPI0012BD576D